MCVASETVSAMSHVETAIDQAAEADFPDEGEDEDEETTLPVPSKYSVLPRCLTFVVSCFFLPQTGVLSAVVRLSHEHRRTDEDRLQQRGGFESFGGEEDALRVRLRVSDQLVGEHASR